MADDIDRAQEREEQMRSDALAEHARRSHGDPDLPSAESCAVCGEPIPMMRRQTLPGVQTCVECQADLEGAIGKPTGWPAW